MGSRRLTRAAMPVALACIATVLVPLMSAQAAPEAFVFTGSGWGHGVGLSQYGAREQAADGRSAQQILGHYYGGTSLGGGAPDAVRVLLVEGLEALTVQGNGSFSFRSGGSTVSTAGGNDGWWTVRPQPAGHFTVERPNGSAAGVATSSQPLRIEYEQSSTIVHLASTSGRYRWGRIELTVVDGGIRAVLEVALERYVRGIAEMPASWPVEALKAQAVAARTYAAHRALKQGHRRPACDCTLYSDTRDQVYRGYEREDPAIAVNARWVGAVDGTAGTIVRYGSEPILSSYHSSSGGRTEASQDVWGGDLPYLRSVDDHWSQRSSNPHRSWEIRLGQHEVAPRLGLSRVDSIEIGSRTAGGGVASAVVRGDRTITVSGTQLRSSLGLRSTKFSVTASGVRVWTGWARVQAGDAGNPHDNPAMSGSHGNIDAVVTGNSTAPFGNRWSATTGRWNNWSRIGSPNSAGHEPAVVVDAHGAAHVVIRGGSGAIWSSRRDPGTGQWSGWTRIGHADSRGSRPRVAAAPDGSVWTVIRGQSPTAWASRRDPGTGRWSPWMRVGGDAYEPTVSVRSDGTVVVVARGGDLAVKASMFNGGFTPWVRISNGFGHAPAVVADGNGAVHAVVRGRTSDQLWASRLETHSWSSWTALPSAVAAPGSTPSAVADGNGTIHLFFRGSGDGIYTSARSLDGAWSPAQRIGSSGDVAGSGADVAAAASGDRVHVMIRGRSGGLFSSSRGV